MIEADVVIHSTKIKDTFNAPPAKHSSGEGQIHDYITI